MRYILYSLYLVFFILLMYFNNMHMGDIVEKLSNYLIIVIVLICIDFAFRLKEARYVFVPIVIGLNYVLGAILNRLPMEYAQWMLVISFSISFNYIAAAYFLYLKWVKMNAESQPKANLIIAMAISLLPIALIDLSEELRKISINILPVNASAMAVTSFIFNIILLGVCAVNFYKNFYSKVMESEKELSLFIGMVAFIPVITYLFHL